MTGPNDGPNDGSAAGFAVGRDLGAGCFRAVFTGCRATRFFGGGDIRFKARLTQGQKDRNYFLLFGKLLFSEVL